MKEALEDCMGFSGSKKAYVHAMLLALILLFAPGCSEKPQDRFDRLCEDGDRQFAEMEYSEAIRNWKSALEIFPDKADLHRKIGLAYMKTAEFPQAIRAFERATALKPDDWKSWLDLGRLHLASQSIEAAQTCRNRLESAPDTIDKLIFFADMHVVHRQFDDAESFYKMAVDMPGDNDPAMVKLASCYIVRNKPEMAESTFSRLDPADFGPELLLMASDYHKLSGNWEQAEKNILKASRMAPENLSVQNAAAVFYYEAGRYEKALEVIDDSLKRYPENRALLKFKAETLTFLGQAEKALGTIRKISGKYGPGLEVSMLAGKCYLLLYRPANAAISFRSAISMEPDLPLAHYYLGLSYLADGQINSALQSLIAALALDPDFIEAELAIADAYYLDRNYETSRQHLLRVCEKEPANFRCHLMMGNIYLARMEYEHAESAFEAARRLKPDLASPIYHAAVAVEKKNELEKAIRLYETLLSRRPDLADAAMRYARLLIRSGQMEKAEKYFRQAVANNSRNAYLGHILGEVYLSSKRVQNAIDSYKQALATDPRLIPSYMRLAEIYRETGNVDARIETLVKCVEYNSRYAEAYSLLSDVYYSEFQNAEKAAEILEKAIENGLESPRIAHNLAWLYMETDRNKNRELELAQYAREKLPGEPAVLDTLGMAYYRKKSFGMAIWQFEEARSMEPAIRRFTSIWPRHTWQSEESTRRPPA